MGEKVIIGSEKKTFRKLDVGILLTQNYNLAGKIVVHSVMKPRNGVKIPWVISVLAVLTVLASCASRPQARLESPSQKMDMRARGACDQYDGSFAETISSNWWNLLDSNPPAYTWWRGKVTLEFTLHSNGKVTDMKIAKRSVSMKDANLCEKAVLKGVPYPSWSREQLDVLGTNYINVEFRFEY